jgi:hypothetical protein
MNKTDKPERNTRSLGKNASSQVQERQLTQWTHNINDLRPYLSINVKPNHGWN